MTTGTGNPSERKRSTASSRGRSVDRHVCRSSQSYLPPGTTTSKETRSCRPSGGRKGFSLIELLLVIVIGGILATVGVPALGGMMKRVKKMGAADEIVESINLARSRAVANPRVNCGVYFDITAGEYVLFFDDNKDNAYTELADRTYDIRNELPQGVELYVVDSAALAGNSVLFEGSGDAVVAGGIGVRSSGQQTGTRVYIHQKSGRIAKL